MTLPSRAGDSAGLNRYNAKFMQIGFSKFNTPWTEFTLQSPQGRTSFPLYLSIDRQAGAIDFEVTEE